MRFIIFSFVLVYAVSVLSMEKDAKIILDQHKKPFGRGQKVIGNTSLCTLIRQMIDNNQYDQLGRLFIQIDSFIDIKKTLNQYDKNGFTILHSSLREQNVSVDIVALLLKNGADPNITLEKNYGQTKKGGCLLYKGWNAAHLAVRINHSQEMLKILLSYNANFFHQDDGGWSPIKLAKKNNREKALDFFEQHRFFEEQ